MAAGHRAQLPGAPTGAVVVIRPGPPGRRPSRRARRVDRALPGGAPSVPRPFRVAVLGGGLAGMAAATVLVERGAQVTLLERAGALGGRLASWPVTLRTGDRVEMGRGFHAFFRQYYNLRALLRRADPDLAMLRPVADYPLVGPGGAMESFAGLPGRPPLNLLALIARTESMGWRDLPAMNPEAAREMFEFDPDRTYAELDDRSAADYLDSLGFPPTARRMLFEVFSRSFFNDPEHLSAAELLSMFHLYFLGTSEGVLFDVIDEPFADAVWAPLRRHLEAGRGVVRTGTGAEAVTRDGDEWRVHTSTGGPLAAEALVLAVSVPGLQALAASSPDLGDDPWRDQVAALTVAPPFAVWRAWLDAPLRPGRPPFVGTTGLGIVDNVSAFHLFEGESRRWALRHGGSVVEVHAYGLPPAWRDPTRVRTELVRRLHEVWPETAAATVLDERFSIDQDCPAFPPGSWATRPTVATPDPTVVVVGDLVRVPFPTALMERAATTGFLGANALLAHQGVAGEPVWSVPPLGWVADLKARARTLVGRRA